MENPEAKPIVFTGERESEYSPISIIIAFLLGVALIVFLQFFVKDITKTLFGEPPETPGFYKTSTQIKPGYYEYEYDGVDYESHQEAKKAFEKAEWLPYETRAILVSTIINGPLFLIAVALIFLLGKLKSSYKLATVTYFIAMSINMLVLLGRLASYIYKVNERLAMYSVSLFLIIVFTTSIIYVQERFRTKTAPAP